MIYKSQNKRCDQKLIYRSLKTPLKKRNSYEPHKIERL